MSKLNPEAQELNATIRASSPAVFHLLSQKGRAIYFPRKGNLSQGAEAKGKRINATIGMAIEDDGRPMRLPSIADKIPLDPKDVFPYAPSHGLPELRKAWQEMIKQKNPSLERETSLPVVTNGLSHGLSIAGYLFIDPGDEIIATDILWENYTLIFEHGRDARFRTFETFKDNRFNTQGLRNALREQPGKQIVLLNFPHNPTGYTLTEEEALSIIQILRENAEREKETLVLLDDAYFGLVYKPGIYRESLFSRLADLHPNLLVVKIDGATKEDYAWGLRVGFITYASRGMEQNAYRALEDKTAGVVRGNISNTSHLSQSLLWQAITSDSYQGEKNEKYHLLKRRFDKVEEVLGKNAEVFSPYFSPLPHNSGYFMCIRLAVGLDAERIRQTLLHKYSTGVIAAGNLLRIAFSSVPEKEIPSLFENIYNACRDCKGE